MITISDESYITLNGERVRKVDLAISDDLSLIGVLSEDKSLIFIKPENLIKEGELYESGQ